MITECPNCNKRFLVMESLFETSQGTVRCGACMKSFKVLDHLQTYDDKHAGLLIESGAQAQQPELAQHKPGSAGARSKNMLAALQHQINRDGGAGHSDQQAPVAAERTRDSAIDRQRGDGRIEPVVPASEQAISMHRLSSQLQPDPVEMSTPEPRRSYTANALRALPALLVASVLGWGLYLQWFDVDPAQLPQNALVQGAYRHTCALLRCSNSVKSGDYVARKLIVYSHPQQADALIVEAVIVNLGARARPFPALLLEFSDLQGELIARQRFMPADYLRGELAGRAALEPTSPVQIQLQIVDPGPRAVNYSLDLIAID